MTQIRKYHDVLYANKFFDVVDMLSKMAIEINNHLLSITSSVEASIEFLYFQICDCNCLLQSKIQFLQKNVDQNEMWNILVKFTSEITNLQRKIAQSDQK